MYEPKHLRRWVYADNYFGNDYSAWFIVCQKTRDSEALERSNFRTLLRDLGGEQEGKVQEVSMRHWCHGSLDLVLVHESATESLQKADELLERMQDYPVNDEEDWMAVEYEDFLASLHGYDYLLSDAAPQDWVERLVADGVDLDETTDDNTIEELLRSRGWLRQRA